MRGWEPLGNVCKGESCKTRAQPYVNIEGGQSNFQSFHGTWGFHYLTINTLQKRAKAYWNVWSDDWATFDYVKFCGMTVTIPADQLHSWMIAFDPYLQTKEGLPLVQNQNNEETWFHPGILINNPNTHLILPQNYHQKKRFYKWRVKPPPGWKGYERFPEAMNYILCHWVWSLFSLNQPFIDICNCNKIAPGTDVCMSEPWWNANGNYDKWVDRQKYEICGQNVSKQQTWGPFLQSQNCSESSFSAYFLYKMYFKFAGSSVWRPVPHVFANSGLVPPAPGWGGRVKTKKHNKKRPISTDDILPGDLDSDGIITTPALKRITGADHPHKRRKLEDKRRVRHLTGQLYNILSKYNFI